MQNICQRYGKDMQGVIPRLQIQDNYLKQRYAKIWQRKLPKALDPLAIKAVTAIKSQHDLYKQSQLRLAVAAIKAVLLFEDLYKL